MIQNNPLLFAKKFYCEKCNYCSNKKSDYNKHLQSKKHKDTNDTLDDTKKVAFICSCGKIYKYHSGFYRHKKTCNFEETSTIIKNENKDEMKELVFKLIHENNEIKNTLLKENQELRNQISEMIPKLGSYNNNKINNKNKFNINVFLNEKCKDALSMDEFISKIEISMKNLLTTKEKGQIQGISNIIIENMNKLSLYERPLHCTDKKRETLYVKNQEWEKDENKEFINKALKSVESKQLKNLNVWLEEHPNYMNNSSEQEEFAKLMSECGKSVDDSREKIIKKLCDNVYIEKDNE
tara:strand:+ start:5287 stop:6171 length:885 start_codon:yes stop_codon:yes gene_type:complete